MRTQKIISVNDAYDDNEEKKNLIKEINKHMYV
jgi:hypothetical protein